MKLPLDYEIALRALQALYPGDESADKGKTRAKTGTAEPRVALLGTTPQCTVVPAARDVAQRASCADGSAVKETRCKLQISLGLGRVAVA